MIGEDHATETHLIPLILQVPNGKRDHITVYGDDYPTPDGTCLRDYIHVVDLADAHVRALEYLRSGGESDIFNLGSGQGFSVKEMIAAAEKATGHSIKAVIGARRAGRRAPCSDGGRGLRMWNRSSARRGNGTQPIRADMRTEETITGKIGEFT